MNILDQRPQFAQNSASGALLIGSVQEPVLNLQRRSPRALMSCGACDCHFPQLLPLSLRHLLWNLLIIVVGSGAVEDP